MRRTLPIVLLLMCAGCGEEEVVQGSSASRPSAGQDRRTREAGEDEEKKTEDIPPAVDFQESAFVESERSRDPFRNFAKAFVDEARGQVESQREVVLEQYAIDELKLVALVTGINPERAMLIDPTGVGHVVTRGQYVGRATVVQPAGGVGAAYEVNWRVDRIRDGDVVLVRDDPSNPEVPSATRVIPLRTEDITAETATGEVGEDLSADLEKMRERLAAMEAAEAANSRRRASESDESR